MKLFPSGITITETEYQCIRYLEADPEQWLKDLLTANATSKRDKIIVEWQQRLFADPNITELPANADALASFIMTQPGYKTRAQRDDERGDTAHPNNKEIFSRKTRGEAAETLFRGGINIPDADYNCFAYYIYDMEDMILGALLGRISKGKGEMIKRYQPMILADPDVETMPGDEDGLIEMITSRSDYETLPEQLARI